ncbi:MAG: WbqC family protein [Bacteroidota bacterium]
MTSCIITQSNYIPWKGYFDSINQVDVFVIYDDMQYTKRDWRNRNYIKTPQGLKWLSIPVEVSGKFTQKINETLISDKSWNRSHWESIKQNYKDAACYKDNKDWLENLYMNCNFDKLTEVNEYFLKGIGDFLGITTTYRRSEEFVLCEDRTQKMVHICVELGATQYFTGPNAKQYIEEDKFSDKGVQLNYFDYSGYKEYPQLYGPFEHGVSIIDMIMNVGKDTQEYLKTFAK